MLCLPWRSGVPQWRASILPPLKREVVSLRPVYIVRNFYHLLFILSDYMGAVFINTILRKENTCLSEFGVTNETKTGYRSFICSACYAIFYTDTSLFAFAFS